MIKVNLELLIPNLQIKIDLLVIQIKIRIEELQFFRIKIIKFLQMKKEDLKIYNQWTQELI
jgi:hypothetical protein